MMASGAVRQTQQPQPQPQGSRPRRLSVLVLIVAALVLLSVLGLNRSWQNLLSYNNNNNNNSKKEIKATANNNLTANDVLLSTTHSFKFTTTTTKTTTTTTTTNETIQLNITHQKQDDEPPQTMIINVCLVTDKKIGRTFNKILALANAMEYAQQLVVDKPNARGIVRIRPPWVALWNEWFLPSPQRVLPLSNDTQCHVSHDSQVHYSGTLLKPRRPAVVVGKQYLPGLDILRSLLKPNHLEDARQALETYRQQDQQQQQQQQQQAAFSNTTMKTMTVTVHLRWMEGSCTRWAATMHKVCPLPPQFQDWKFTCAYTPEFCRQHVLQQQQQKQKQQEDANNTITVIVSMSDGQRKNLERQYKHHDKHSFPVQVAMMMLSDYHFGSPMSSIDFVVAHWRQNSRQFPESCYQGLWQLQEEQQQKQQPAFMVPSMT